MSPASYGGKGCYEGPHRDTYYMYRRLRPADAGARGASRVPGYALHPPGPATLLIQIDALLSSRLTRGNRLPFTVLADIGLTENSSPLQETPWQPLHELGQETAGCDVGPLQPGTASRGHYS